MYVYICNNNYRIRDHEFEEWKDMEKVGEERHYINILLIYKILKRNHNSIPMQ